MPCNDPKPLPEITEEDVERFCKYIDKSPGHGPKGDCWLWTGWTITRPNGKYGIFQVKVRGKKKLLKATRIVYFLLKGEDPFPFLVMHTCDFPPCVNPDHLNTGTNRENQLDCFFKGRRAKGLKNGNYTKPESRAFGLKNGKYTKPEKTPRGEQHGMSKLNSESVVYIRTQFFFGRSLSDISREFSMDVSSISDVIHRRTWAHVP